MTTGAMTDGGTATAVTRQLAELTGTDARDWHLVFKARYGMLETFAALAEHRPQRRVVTQLLTCATAVDPILVAGLTPTYAEISPQTMSIDPDRLDVGDATAVVIQHTFGIIDDASAGRVAAAAREAGAIVCEDSAHCIGRMARNPAGEPLADVSFHSFGIEKMLSTKFGGAVWVNPLLADADLRAAMVARLTALKAPGPRLALAARTYRYQLALLNRLPRAVSRPLRSLLITTGVFSPAIAPIENAGGLAHGSLTATPWMTRTIADAMARLAQVEKGRTRAVAAYVDALGDSVEIPAAVRLGQPLVRFPLLAPADVDPDALIAHLRAQGIIAGSWYRPALFPGVTDAATYGYRQGDASHAVTEAVIGRIVNLPTNVSEDSARNIAGQVIAFIDSSRGART